MDASLVTPARDRYLDEFRRVLARHPRAHLEPALRNDGGDLVLDGELRLPYRADLITRDAGGSVMVDSPGRATIPESTQLVAGIPVEIRPFVWDYTHFHLFGTQERDWSQIRSWFLAWFDPEDKNPLNAEGFYGVAHCVLDPEPIADGIKVIVDFGSAPVEAFEQCLAALAQTGVSRIEVV